MEATRRRAGRIWTVTSAVACGLAVCCWLTYSGPYRWLAEWQLARWGWYFEGWTLIAVVAILLAAARAGLSVLARVHPGWFAADRRQAASPRTRPQHDRAGEPTAPPAAGGRVLLFFLLLSLLATAGGVYYYAKAATAGPLTRTTVREIESGRRPASNWLQITGAALPEAGISLKEGSHSAADHYLPLVSEDRRAGKPVAVFIKGTAGGIERVAAGGPVRGMATWSRLPGPVAEAFRRAGLTPAEGYLVLDLGDRPEMFAKAGRYVLPVGLAGLGVCGLIWLLRGGWRRLRRGRPADAARNARGPRRTG